MVMSKSCKKVQFRAKIAFEKVQFRARFLQRSDQPLLFLSCLAFLGNVAGSEKI